MIDVIKKIHTPMVLAGLYILAFGIFASNTISALSHFAFFIPGLFSTYYFLKNDKIKKLPLSLLFLSGLFFIYNLSIVVNLEIIEKPWAFVSKTRYLFFAIISFFAILDFVTKKPELFEKHRHIIIRVLIWSSVIATCSGMIALFTGHNYLKMKPACHIDRACGLYGMYMTYGYGMGLLVPFTLSLLFKNKLLAINVSYFERILFVVVNSIGLFFSYARGAWLGFLSSILFLFDKNFKKAVAVILIICAALTGSYFFSTGVQYIVHRRAESDHDRLAFYKSSLIAFTRKPILGYGHRNFETYSSKIKTEYNMSSPQFKGHAHNNFLENLASTGILGFSFFVLWLFFWIYESWRDPVLRAVSIPFIASFVVSGLFQYSFGDGENLYFILILYILSTVYYYVRRKNTN